MAYWLVKSEPGTWSWADHKEAGVAEWDGVRNFQARNNLKGMKVGDLAFFYHSVNEKQIVGIVEVVKEYYPDPTDESGRFGMVDFKAKETLGTPVTLEAIKKDSQLSQMALVRQGRLSVMPVEESSWNLICQMGGIGKE
ncbi:MAG: EVE domain-containing protein [Alphaproteobacteria bacterium]|nr:EVE domain-containing protein [Alphaproteobacteria bacterium]MBT5390097.1 EVE domain-containing protein [Alphaproteobacteria bacterium]MBT5540769.1 EVE domain-containing protein [Alphaproteobacteria bacterium]MBT5654747.1 EVE domain-containing protein [Alphaproteobacteria bacterium]